MMLLNLQKRLKFSRRVRLKGFFAPDQEKEDSNNSDTEEDTFTKVKRKQSSFIPPAGCDSSLDFYLEAITHEILQHTKRTCTNITVI